MKKASRVLSLLMALCLCLCIVPHAYAAQSVGFSVESVTAQTGGTARVRILMKNSPGIVNLRLHVSYDAQKLTLTDAEAGDLAGVSFGPTTGKPFTLSWTDAIHPAVTGDAVVATLVFSVKESATGSAALMLSCDAEDVFDSNFDNVPYTLSSGSVSVSASHSAQIISVSRTSGGASAVVSCFTQNATVYCAAYDKYGRMTRVGSKPAVNGQNTYTFSVGTAHSVKVFVLDGGFRPLCEGKSG